MDTEDEEIYCKLQRSKGKYRTHLLTDGILDLKPRTRRHGKCIGAALTVYPDIMAAEQPSSAPVYNVIGNDVWFHVADYIAPEDVQTYASICRQSANSLRSCRFWRQLYRRYCQKSRPSQEWMLHLPSHLQADNMYGCDVRTLRQRVIEALFYCHKPFTERLQRNYKLDMLVGRTYLTSWHIQVQCVWLICYKFRLHMPQLEATDYKSSLESIDDGVVNDWEALAVNNESDQELRLTHAQEGISLLVICCDRFIPFPNQLLYNRDDGSQVRLQATRERLSTDMRGTNLELDFVNATGRQKTTVTYTQITKYKVLPWWHPDFQKFIK